MILDREDYALAQDYINTIKQEEAILWEGRMFPIEIKNPLLKNEVLLIINLILLLIGFSIATFLLAVGLTLIVLAILLGGYLFSLQKQQGIIRHDKLKYNKYLITSKRCIFIHWYQEQIHINSIATNSIQSIKTYRNSNGETSVLFQSKPSPDFEMSYFVDNEKTDSIGFINIGQ